jgi:hypothetical protein
MSAPKQPRTTPSALDAVPIQLTPAELSLLGSFRAINDSGQAFLGRTADSLAEDCPRRAAPSLRLVKFDHAKR